ncbi:MAG: dUTP diphosphatase [Rhodospirillaceae bacterium]|nr:dUTP diphosphatase [Rhodospirillaceae bacterium]
MTKPFSLTISIKRLPNALNNRCPTYMTEGCAGMDLEAAPKEPITLNPMCRVKVPTGFAIALPNGYEAQVRPRSGLALKEGLTVLNSPGTIDSDYRGEINVILANFGEKAQTIVRGMRIAQLVVAPITHVLWQEIESLPKSIRNDGGFGSTGATSEDKRYAKK